MSEKNTVLAADEFDVLVAALRDPGSIGPSPVEIAMHCLGALGVEVYELVEFATGYRHPNPLVPHIGVGDVRDSVSDLRREHPEIDVDDRAAVERVLDNPYKSYPTRSERFVTWCIATARVTPRENDDVYFVPDEPGHEENEQATRWHNLPGADITERPAWMRPEAMVTNAGNTDRP